MLRLTDIQLPLNHDESAIQMAVLQKLAIQEDALLQFDIFRRS